jgi:single-stranded-DNA-specific exonuclease
LCGEIEVEVALQIDEYLSLPDLSLDLVAEIERLAPFGPGNPSLTLATRGLSLASQRVIGRNAEHRLLVVEDEEGVAQKVVWWRGTGTPLPEGRFDLAYVVRANEYRGQREVQVEWVDARPIEEPPAVVVRPARPQIEVIDHRQAAEPRTLLDQLRAREEVQVWSEAGARAEVGGQDRNDLERARALAIWTTPPGPSELREALAQVSPEKVYLFGVDPGLDDAEPFLVRLVGLVKHALSMGRGKVDIPTLAAATAQREGTVRVGLNWLAARGHLTLLDEEDGVVFVDKDGTVREEDTPRLTALLRASLEETAAYRAHFARVEENSVWSR